MAGYPQPASELFQLAALFRRSAENSNREEIREQLRNAATEIEARARRIAQGNPAPADSAQSPFAPIDFLA